MSIEKAYDAWSVQYDTNQNKTRDLDAKATIETLSHYAFDNVLELGCGTGKNTRWLLSKGSKVIGLDFSKQMLNRAQTKIQDNRVEFIHTDLNNEWPVSDNSVDLVTSSLTLEHIIELTHIYSQANRVLQENGKFFISELHPFKQYTGSQAKFESDHGTEKLEVYTHHISEYLQCAKQNGFSLVELNEWFDNENTNELPRLVSFVFQKMN